MWFLESIRMRQSCSLKYSYKLVLQFLLLGMLTYNGHLQLHTLSICTFKKVSFSNLLMNDFLDYSKGSEKILNFQTVNIYTFKNYTFESVVVSAHINITFQNQQMTWTDRLAGSRNGRRVLTTDNFFNCVSFLCCSVQSEWRFISFVWSS